MHLLRMLHKQIHVILTIIARRPLYDFCCMPNQIDKVRLVLAPYGTF